MNIEIERKFIIAYPDISQVVKLANCIIEIEQIYLKCDSTTEARRVRKAKINNNTSYYYTHKKDIDAYAREEKERQISINDYNELIKEAITSKLLKTRYCILYGKQTLEIDIYPFWNDFAILEIENINKFDSFALPNYLQVIKEVTENKDFSNFAIAKKYAPLK